MPEEKKDSFLKGKNSIVISAVVVIAIVVIAAIVIFLPHTGGSSTASAQSAASATTAPASLSTSAGNAATDNSLYTIKESYIGDNGAGSGSVVEVIDVADKLGYLKDGGIQLVDVGAIGTSNTDKVAALTKGVIDVAHIPVPTAVAMIGAGVKAKFIAPLMTTTAKMPDGTTVSTGGLVVRKGSALTSPQDFYGKTIALTSRGSSPDYFLQEWFSQNGADIKKVNIVVVPTTSTIQALKSGQVDGVWLFSSGYFDALDDVSLETTVRDSDVVGSRLHCGYLVRNDFIQQHPDVAANLTKAIVKAWNWEADHPAELNNVSKQILIDHNMDPSLSKYVYAWNLPDGVIRDSDIQFWIDKLTANGQLKANLTPADVYTDQFNPNYKP